MAFVPGNGSFATKVKAPKPKQYKALDLGGPTCVDWLSGLVSYHEHLECSRSRGKSKMSSGLKEAWLPKTPSEKIPRLLLLLLRGVSWPQVPPATARLGRFAPEPCSPGGRWQEKAPMKVIGKCLREKAEGSIP